MAVIRSPVAGSPTGYRIKIQSCGSASGHASWGLRSSNPKSCALYILSGCQVKRDMNNQNVWMPWIWVHTSIVWVEAWWCLHIMRGQQWSLKQRSGGEAASEKVPIFWPVRITTTSGQVSRALAPTAISCSTVSVGSFERRQTIFLAWRGLQHLVILVVGSWAWVGSLMDWQVVGGDWTWEGCSFFLHLSLDRIQGTWIIYWKCRKILHIQMIHLCWVIRLSSKIPYLVPHSQHSLILVCLIPDE